MMSGSNSSDLKSITERIMIRVKIIVNIIRVKNMVLLNVDNKAIKRGRIIGVLVPVQRRRRRKNSVQT